MAQPGALSSDHINYLILRYLQESGHETTARAFYKDWHRPREYRDPEDLPFTPTVRHYELVSVIQDGLAHDELQARVGRNERRFRWTMDATSENMEEGGENGSRPPSSGKRKGRLLPPGGMRAPDEFPTPAAKRQRFSPRPEAVHVNGDRDAMDVDAASPSVGEGDEDAEAASPEAGSDDATEAPAERYDSLDVATQTEVRRGPKTSTISFRVSKPEAKVFHSSWSPSEDSKGFSTLFAVGEGLCRYYRVPNLEDGDLKTIEHVDEPSISPNSIITASAWHPNGRMATCAVDTLRDLPGDKQPSTQTLMDIGRDFGTVVYPSSLPLLDPPGLVTCIRYSASGDHILVARTNLKRGLVQVYETPTDAEKAHLRKEPVAWRIFEHQVTDATWTNESSFLVCGDQGITKLYKLLKSEEPLTNGFTPESVAIHNLAEQSLEIAPNVTKWDKVRFDAQLGLHIFASTTEKKLAAYVGPNSATGKASHTVELEIPEKLFALALQPRKDSSEDEPTAGKSILAASFEDGTAILYALSLSEGTVAFERLVTLELGQNPALALSWSPDGNHLALGGADTVRIWRIDNENLNAVDTRALVTWRQPAEVNGSTNGDHQDETEALSEPSLSWSSDGERLGFAVEKQIAVISFRPPLSAGDEVHANGAMSP
ncbi:hypothetical protein WHR41_00478 [Cladosporium halotolerans]|uniref:LisH domain-containing protein n=1 Tax=Cladosporium halotolerans TaxID=1052096 RepID=A0AB34L1H9_9PEZI